MAYATLHGHDLVMRGARPSFQVVLVVAEHDGRYLVIKEAFDEVWYLPAGGVEHGETIAEGARRETREEAGIEIEPLGMLRMEEHMRSNGTYVQRFVLAGKPLTFEPKATPDHHSVEARFLTLAEIRKLRLRDPEVIEHILDHQRALGGALPMAPYGFGVIRC